MLPAAALGSQAVDRPVGAGHPSAVHWADRTAAELLELAPRHTISTGISPSGQFHLGHLREIMTADAVFRALGARGAAVDFHFFSDNLDPLRKIYPFLNPERFAAEVGKPLCAVIAPQGEGSYADYFTAPFLAALEQLRIRPQVLYADQVYASGRMNRVVLLALAGRDRIAAILKQATGREVAADWSPFNVICEACGRLNRTVVTGFDPRRETVAYRCACGAAGERPIAGAGKLTWRADWPARWAELGVSFEPFGKDHATTGGSYETGALICREVFQAEPPKPLVYEWIRLAGQGDMSSSKGNVLSIEAMLEVVPPEVLRYLIVRTPPQKSISFDPGLPLLKLVDEVDDLYAAGRDARSAELSSAGGFVPVGVPFRHVVTVTQITDDPQAAAGILAGQGYQVDPATLARRMAQARRWLERFAPEEVRFSLQPQLPAAARSLSPPQRAALAALAASLKPDWSGEQIHKLIYDLAQEHGLPATEIFSAAYLALLGKPRGPRLGMFLALLDREFVVARLKQAAAA